MINSENKKIKIIFNCLIILILSIFFFLNISNFPGNKLLFLIYFILVYFLILIIFKKNTTYFEFFFFSFFILGFWLKPNLVFLFEYLRFTEGDISRLNTTVEKKKEIFNEAFFVIIISFLACIISSFLKKYLNIILNKKEIKKSLLKENFVQFYKRNRFGLFFLYVFFLLLINYVNILFQIYNKGLTNSEIPTFLRLFFAWYFNYGLSALTAIYIFIDISIFKQKRFILIGFFESFVSNISVMSRAFLLTFIAYLKGMIDLASRLKLKFFYKNIALLAFIATIFFIISFLYVEKLRSKSFLAHDNTNKNIMLSGGLFQKFKNQSGKIIIIGASRWVGIDGLLSVSAKDNKSFDLFYMSLFEKPNHGKQSFYMKNFFTNFKFESNLSKNMNTVILPGLVAFLYYSGSYLFVFFGMIFFLLLFTYLEMLFIKHSLNNNILLSIIGFSLAWRLSNFGYLPMNTIQFIFSFLVTLLIVMGISKLLWKK